MVKWVFQNTEYTKEDTLFIFEHTGMYSDLIMSELSELGLYFSMVPGLEIKRSMGITRGKTDQKDAKMIALYGYRLRDEIKLTKIPSKELQKLKRLISLRDLFAKQRTSLKNSYGERKEVLLMKENKVFFEVQKQTINFLTKKIEKIEEEIEAVIRSSNELRNVHELLTSIKGVGNVTAWYIIVYTECFSNFST